MRAFLEQKTHQRERGKGTPPHVAKRLAAFDAMSAVRRLAQAYQTLIGRRVQQTIVGAYKDLMQFRNNCVHGDPVVILSSGTDQTTWGENIVEPRSGNPYPFLWESNRPLSLSHALQAVRVYDGIVHDLLVNTSTKLQTYSDLHDERPEGNLVEARLPKPFSSEVLDQLASDWNSVERKLQTVPDEETRALLFELNRKVNIHSAD
jgi:hypothetical protein